MGWKSNWNPSQYTVSPRTQETLDPLYAMIPQVLSLVSSTRDEMQLYPSKLVKKSWVSTPRGMK